MLPTVSDLDDFHALRHNSDWLNAASADKSAAIYKASDYISATYLIDGYENDPRVITALMMLAPELLDDPLMIRAGEQAILSREDGIGNGAIVEKRTFAAPSDDPYPLITALLAAFPRRIGSGARLRIVRLSR